MQLWQLTNRQLPPARILRHITMSACALAPLVEAYLAPGFCAGTLPITIGQARSIAAVGPADFLALERSTGSLKVVEDLDLDGIPESVRTLVTLSGLNHGFVTTPTHLYASSSSAVYRWSYNPTSKTVSGSSTVVINNINDNGAGGSSQGNHVTRTLVWKNSTLYVSVGSVSNIDANSYRARIRRFPINSNTVFPISFAAGEVFADGLRNEVAMEFSPKDGFLWGAGNSADNLDRNDLSDVIYNDNPAEELHRFDARIGANYGYPFCWREYQLPAATSQGRGTAFAWPGAPVSDANCRNNYVPPVLAMQAHSAPLGLTFYEFSEERPSECDGVIPFPPQMDGFIFIAFHGSWNREVPTGYKVVYVPTNADGSVQGGIGADPITLLAHEGSNAKWPDNFRPVDVSFDACGRLLVSSDGSNGRGSKIVRVEWTQPILVPVGPLAVPVPAPVVVPSPVVAPSPPSTLFRQLLNFLAYLFNILLPFRGT